jgi:hypothetical protein
VTLVGPQSVIKFLFGAPDTDNATTETVPANTLIWTSWIVNSTTSLAAQGTIGVSTQYVNSSFSVAIYVNGMLAGNQTYTLYPSSSPAFSTGFVKEGADVGIPTRMEPIPAGAVVSFAVLASIPLGPSFDTGIGVQTNEASINAGSGFPQQLPQSTSTIPSTLQMFAYTEEG